jgi:anti-sigma regulatory factor (Ser/Thr protein kinase)
MTLPGGPAGAGPSGESFRHEALLYAGEAEFVAATAAFIRAGLASGEAILAVVDPPKIALLRSALGDQADDVEFADMRVVGHNPGRILDAWYRFAADHAAVGAGARGIGEPVFPGRSRAELVECQLHEALINVAFPPHPAWSLLCPYDTSSLGAEVLAEARRSHPLLRLGTETMESPHYHDGDGLAPRQFHDPLPPPAAGAPPVELAIDPAHLGAVRRLVHNRAARAGASAERAGEAALAASELATNSLRHGGGRGRLLLWLDDGRLVCEVADGGHVSDPLVGRRRPTNRQLEGRGLWLVNQLCDLVQIRTSPRGTVVRAHMRLA